MGERTPPSPEDKAIGRRLQEIRADRKMSQRAVAELAGYSAGYLSLIENGERAVDKRSTLEALATALRVAPSELAGKPSVAKPAGFKTQVQVLDLEVALDLHELGDDPGEAIRDWPQIAADVARLSDLTYFSDDDVARSGLAPRLITELHGAYRRLPEHRQEVLLGLIICYTSACWVTKRLGDRGLPLLAARKAQQCADELDLPQWRGYAAWLRGNATGELSRPHQYRRAVSMADELSSDLDEPDVLQAYGMLHLNAALAAAAQVDRDTAITHLDEAAAVADRMDTQVGAFGRLWFGSVNVGIWRTAIAVEFGDGPKVAEIGRTVEVEAIPSPSRRAEFYRDLGRSLLPGRATRDAGVEALLRAEKLAPRSLQYDVFVRETVTAQVRRLPRDSREGRELRGLAHRMGISV